jgi:divalent metal cation (Fe/Co/Zn/Cd) transporter
LIGEGADPEVVTGLRKIADQDERILRINEALTTHLGPHDVLANLSLDFADELSAGDVEAAISQMERHIKEEYPQVRRVFIEAQSWHGHARDQARGEADES